MLPCSRLHTKLWKQSVQLVAICLALGFSGKKIKAHSSTASDYDVNRLALSVSLSPTHTLFNTLCLNVDSVDGHFELSSQWPGPLDKRTHLNGH